MAVSEIVPPTAALAGLAPTASMRGQALSTPLTMMLPVCGCRLQVIPTGTVTVVVLVTSNDAEPMQMPRPSVVVPLRAI